MMAGSVSIILALAVPETSLYRPKVNERDGLFKNSYKSVRQYSDELADD